MVPIIFMSTFLLQFTVSEALNPQYILWVPSVMQSHSTEQACLHLLNLNESVSLSVVLEYDGSNSTIFDQTVEEDNFYSCANFEVSHKSSDQMAFVTLLVKGDTLKIFERRSVALSSEETVTFVQTDKPIYKSGENVKLRIVTLDTKFLPINEVYPLITLQDPQDNRIFQWQNVTSSQNITELSFQLILEPVFGDYSIVVKEKSGKTLTHQFTVNRNVLPKFEVKVSAPQTITISDDEFQVSTCAKYTFGQPVHGKVHIQVCREFFSSGACEKDKNEICEQFVAQLKNGCVSQIINTKVFQLYRSGLFMSFYITTTVTEIGTGVQISEKSSIFITPVLGSVSFKNMDPFYRRGISYFGTLKFSDPNNVPMVNKLLQLELNDRLVGNYTTDENGEAQFSIDTSDIFDPEFRLKATYVRPQSCYLPSWLIPQYMDGLFLVQRFYSRTSSFLMIEPEPKELRCDQEKIVTVHYSLNSEAYRDDSNINFFYLVMVKGTIFLSGQKEIRNKAWKGNISFPINVSADLAPVAVMLVYTLHPSGEIIADSVKFQVEKCFKNKVNLSFSSAQGLPASNTSLKVTAAPYSLCGLRAVDQSVLLMKPEDELSPQSVYNLLPVKRIFSMGYGGPMNEDGEKCISAEDITHNGVIYTPKQLISDDDVYSIFESAGLSIFTNSKIHKPYFCQPLSPYPGMPVTYANVGPPVGGAAMLPYPLNARDDSSAVKVKETIRKYFPETWIWELIPLDISGRRELAIQVPDTITEWKASALCLSETAGLGLSPTISLTVFQPFFLELTLPYSVVRGEAFTLKATVFNYLSHCIRVSVQLEASSAFLAIPVEKNEESHCVCGNKQKTVSWAVTPKSLGEVNFTATAEALRSQELCGSEVPHFPELGQKDTVIKPLLVEPEGIEREETFNTLLCASETGESEKLSLKLPSNVVEGSARATYAVLGDILGSAMQNLQNLLQMPYGCGEQNMVLFTPNIYVLNYLNETGQLTEKIKSRAISYLISGYQRQLNYKHSDGSYSTFGDRGGRSQGNTWLTAFVLKSFSQAQSHIFVEDSHIRDSLTWLSQKQKENGCFQRSGSLLNNAIKGGVDDEVTLSAYITIGLLEMPLLVTHPVVRNALFCLERAWQSASEAQESLVYTKALLAYAFALAGDQAKRKELLESLDKEAVREEDSIHWQRPGKSREVNELYSPHRAPSVDVEMTSYCLLAYLTAQPAPSSEDLSVATKIVRWLTKQQNPNGGFSSTQDTVVALQALSRYGAATFTKGEKAATVTIKSAETFSEEFRVDEAKRLLLQEVALPKIPGEYNTAVSGSGCVYIQTSLRYNILPKKEGKAPFTLKVETLPKGCDRVSTHRKVQIHINISYTGERPSSNMVIVDVKMVSGFIPVKSSVRKLQEMAQIQRTEVNANHVLIYFEELIHQILSFSFSVEQDIAVKNLKPATVKAYDYYETEEFTIEEYSVPCSAESEHRSD
ncbi:unnamed protein product [Rangifer tarandus platyrhynchus]|uniref:Uncharacterized protein n=1 Tax=Rangifer tarandus platyrhynchus TaxID=3082113 RepID=A0AC59Z7R6_RANTA